MSYHVRIRDIGERAAGLSLDLVWSQWGVLNSHVIGTESVSDPTSVIDPEALILTSLALLTEERRLLDVIAWWANVGSALISVQRMGTLSGAFEDADNYRIFGHFAHKAKDLRWAKHSVGPPDEPRASKGPPVIGFRPPSTLMLRMRALIGPGARADILTFLLAEQGAPHSAKDIARAVDFSEKITREAAQAMALSGMLETSDGYPLEYMTRPGLAKNFLALLHPWETELDVPEWRYWAQIYPFLLATQRWARANEHSDEYIASTTARELFETHRWAFRVNGIRHPDPMAFFGESYLPAFEQSVIALQEWVQENR